MLRQKFYQFTQRLFFSIIPILCMARLLNAQIDFEGRIVYQVPGMDKVKAFKNLTYKTADTTELKMDIYTPPNLSKDDRLPAVIFIHGGYLSPDLRPLPKDWGVYISYGELMAASGLVGVTFNHRYWGLDEQNMNLSFSDVRDAIQFVRQNAEKYHIDPERIVLWAFSGGGPHLSIPLKERMDYVRCIVSYYAGLDLSPTAQQLFLDTDPKYAEQFSPIVFLTEENDHIPPIFIGRAGFDSPAINTSVDDFVARAFALNLTIEVMNHPVGRHGFDMLDDDDRSREIIKRTIEFIKERTRKDVEPIDPTARLAARLFAALNNSDIAQSKALYQEAVKKFGNEKSANYAINKIMNEATINGIGYRLLSTNQPKAAIDFFKWNIELYPESPNVYDSLADGFETDGQAELAIEYSKKALEMLEKMEDIPEARRNTIKQSAEAKLKRLKKL